MFGFYSALECGEKKKKKFLLPVHYGIYSLCCLSKWSLKFRFLDVWLFLSFSVSPEVSFLASIYFWVGVFRGRGHLRPIVRPGKFLYGDCDFDEELFVSILDNV